eukprot:366437-Chlamydomonas_euryale.AAC.6
MHGEGSPCSWAKVRGLEDWPTVWPGAVMMMMWRCGDRAGADALPHPIAPPLLQPSQRVPRSLSSSA